MKLKKYCWLAIIFLLLLLFSSAFAEKPEEGKRPQAHFPENTFTFDKTLEGTLVMHDFVIKNSGNAPLIVEKVNTT
jgi:hypothetical protein